MEKEVELFDKKFVHFMWDDELEGKEVIAANYISSLRKMVENGGIEEFGKGWDTARKGIVSHSEDDEDFPFEIDGVDNALAYYDPNYEAKRAYYKEGKELQYLLDDCWLDCKGVPNWESGYTFRVKPKVVWCVCETTGHGLQIVKLNDETECAALFKGTGEECIKWVKKHEMKCPCEDGIDSKACVGCEHSEDGKPEYKPYESVEEFIQDYQERFPTNFPRPAYTKPLIWVRLKVDKRERLIVAYGDNFVEIGNKTKTVTLQHLFEQYEFLDESPVGMEYAK